MQAIESMMQRIAKRLSGKASYQGKALHSRIVRQQIMIKEQTLLARKLEHDWLEARSTLINYLNDLDILFILSDRDSVRLSLKRKRNEQQSIKNRS